MRGNGSYLDGRAQHFRRAKAEGVCRAQGQDFRRGKAEDFRRVKGEDLRAEGQKACMPRPWSYLMFDLLVALPYSIACCIAACSAFLCPAGFRNRPE